MSFFFPLVTFSTVNYRARVLITISQALRYTLSTARHDIIKYKISPFSAHFFVGEFSNTLLRCALIAAAPYNNAITIINLS